MIFPDMEFHIQRSYLGRQTEPFFIDRRCCQDVYKRQRLRELAEKAKFSNHVLTPEELGALTEYAGQCAARREKESGPLRRFWEKWILCLY